MILNEIIILRTMIKSSYPGFKDNNDEDNIIWLEMLQECDNNKIIESFKNYIRTSNVYPPSVAQLLNEYRKLMCGNVFYSLDDYLEVHGDSNNLIIGKPKHKLTNYTDLYVDKLDFPDRDLTDNEFTKVLTGFYNALKNRKVSKLKEGSNKNELCKN